MRTIINGKRYNTKTSELVQRKNNGSETLYRTQKGHWFLEKCFSDNSIKLIELNEDEVLGWMKENKRSYETEYFIKYYFDKNIEDA